MSNITTFMLTSCLLIAILIYVLFKKFSVGMYATGTGWADEIFGSDAKEIDEMLRGALTLPGLENSNVIEMLDVCVNKKVVLTSVRGITPERFEFMFAGGGAGSGICLTGSVVGRSSASSLLYLRSATGEYSNVGFSARVVKYSYNGSRYTLDWIVSGPFDFTLEVTTKFIDLSGAFIPTR